MTSCRSRIDEILTVFPRRRPGGQDRPRGNDSRVAGLFWNRLGISVRFQASAIKNLSVEETAHRATFVRTARITHRTDCGEELSYVIRQVTELRGGRVVSQVNEQIG